MENEKLNLSTGFSTWVKSLTSGARVTITVSNPSGGDENFEMLDLCVDQAGAFLLGRDLDVKLNRNKKGGR